MRLQFFTRAEGERKRVLNLRRQDNGVDDLTTPATISITPAPSAVYVTLDDGRIVPAIATPIETSSPAATSQVPQDTPIDTGTASFSSPTPTQLTPTPSDTPGFTYSDNPVDEETWAKFSQGVKAAVIIAAIFGVVAIVVASLWFCCGTPRRRRLKAEEDMERYRARVAAERAAGTENGTGNGEAAVQEPLIQVPMQTLSRENVAAAGNRVSMPPVAARGAVGRVAERLSRHMSVRSTTTAGGDMPPPMYEEHVPPGQQRLAGGMVARRGDQSHSHNQIQPMVEEEEGMGMVADGKTPLSEIPFEDVVITPTNQSLGSASGSGSGSSRTSGSEGGRDFGERHAIDNGGGNTYGHTNA